MAVWPNSGFAPPSAASLVGQVFGKLTVKTSAGPSPKGEGHQWLCACECGNERTVVTKKLRGGDILSCGCSHKQKYSGSKKGRKCSKKDHLGVTVDTIEASKWHADKEAMNALRSVFG